MKKLSSIDMRTINEAVKSGFTYVGDAHFRTGIQGVRTIDKLVRMNILSVNRDGLAIIDFQPTQLARDIVKYGSLEAALA